MVFNSTIHSYIRCWCLFNNCIGGDRMKTIEQIRDELANKYVDSEPDGYDYQYDHCGLSFKIGFDEAVKHLAEIGMAEFDSQKFRKWWANSSIILTNEDCARWQHEQTAAQIGALKERIEVLKRDLEIERSIHKTMEDDQTNEIDALKAQLADKKKETYGME